MKLLSWNVNVYTLSQNLNKVVEAIGSVKPDLVTLQEVNSELAGEMAKCLAGLGLKDSFDSGKDAPAKVNLVLSLIPTMMNFLNDLGQNQIKHENSGDSVFDLPYN